MTEWIAVPLGYLLGSFQWGLYIVKATKQIDVRTVGSGKTGATNVLRSAGKGAAIGVFFADVVKGLAAVLVARLVTDDASIHAGAATAVIVGHIFPVLAGFKGGRGIATGLGTIIGLGPWGPLLGLAVFILVVVITRYVSLGSVLGVLTVMAVYLVRTAWFDSAVPYLLFVLVAGSLVIWMHRENIKRLIGGTERRIGRSAT